MRISNDLRGDFSKMDRWKPFALWLLYRFYGSLRQSAPVFGCYRCGKVSKEVTGKEERQRRGVLGLLRKKHRAKITQADAEKMGFLKNESMKGLSLLTFPHMVCPIVVDQGFSVTA
jgi:hypothetical protein